MVYLTNILLLLQILFILRSLNAAKMLNFSKKWTPQQKRFTKELSGRFRKRGADSCENFANRSSRASELRCQRSDRKSYVQWKSICLSNNSHLCFTKYEMRKFRKPSGGP